MVPLQVTGFHRLSLFRPSTEDLVLTKMMHVDPQDRDNVLFLLGQEDYCPARMRRALAEAVVPGIPEIRAAFEANTEWLRPHWA